MVGRKTSKMDKEVLEKELSPFLTLETPENLKTVALENVMKLTGTDEGRKFLGESEKLIEGIVSLTSDKRTEILENAFTSLINLAIDEETSFKILSLKTSTAKLTEWLVSVLNAECKLADLISKLLSNLTRSEKCAKIVATVVMDNKEIGIENIVLVLCNLTYNNNADLHYLAALLSNLSQIREIRTRILDQSGCVVQRLLPFTEFRQSDIRRRGIIGTLKNCCFDTEYHDWLLSEAVDILPRLLLPLAGPEEFDEEDTEKLPDDLQYLPPDKQREAEPEIRKMLVEALLQLCATLEGRRFVKQKNTYVIMREYYKWEHETYPANETTALNLIDVLIGDEPPEDMKNLKDVEIPDDIQEKFRKEDEAEEEENAKLKTNN